jgi:hypothetical protein
VTRAALEHIDSQAVRGVADGRPERTRKGYAQDWTSWSKFCADTKVPVLAVTSGTLVMFVEWLWTQPGWKKGTFTAPSTINRRISGTVVSARAEHGLKLEDGVARLARNRLKQLVKEMEAIGETRGCGQAPPLLVDHLVAISAACPDNLRGIRELVTVGDPEVGDPGQEERSRHPEAQHLATVSNLRHALPLLLSTSSWAPYRPPSRIRRSAAAGQEWPAYSRRASSSGVGTCRVRYGWPLKSTVTVSRHTRSVEIPKSRASWSLTCRARVPVTIRTVPAGAPGGGSAAPSRACPDCVCASLWSAMVATVASSPGRRGDLSPTRSAPMSLTPCFRR